MTAAHSVETASNAVLTGAEGVQKQVVSMRPRKYDYVGSLTTQSGFHWLPVPFNNWSSLTIAIWS